MDARSPSNRDYRPPRNRMGWERLQQELAEADTRIAHYLREHKANRAENERLRGALEAIQTVYQDTHSAEVFADKAFAIFTEALGYEAFKIGEGP